MHEPSRHTPWNVIDLELKTGPDVKMRIVNYYS